jgi:Uma2 family endonuclease
VATSLQSRAQPKTLTLSEYAALDDPEYEFVTELVRGVVVREPRPRNLHGEVQVEIAFHLRAWARSRGAVVTAESGYILEEEPATVRGPDVALTLERRTTEGVPGGWVRGAPDLAVEVLSPSDSASAIQQKILEYFHAGARLVWIVDPQVRAVIVHRPDGSAAVLRDGESLEGGDVLEGFAVAVSELLGSR